MASEQLKEEFGRRIVRRDDRVHLRVEAIFQRLLSTVRSIPALSECAEGLDWKLFVVQTDEFNCFALPNGTERSRLPGHELQHRHTDWGKAMAVTDAHTQATPHKIERERERESEGERQIETVRTGERWVRRGM